MANYLLVVRHGTVAPVAEDILSALSRRHPREVLDRPLGGGWELTWVARDAVADVDARDGTLFSGFAVDDEHERIVFGASGHSRLPAGDAGAEDLPGCYTRVRWDQQTLSVSTDLYRSMSMFVSTEPGLVLVSDSAYVLMSLRRRLGLQCTADATVADSLRWGNSMSAQLMGSRTLVQEISYVPVGQRVRLSLARGPIRSEVQRRPLRELFQAGSDDYAAELRTAAVRIASLVHTIAGGGPQHARLSLSGGKDSRICLAAALLSPVARETARFSCTNTSEQHRRDFEVVSALAEEFRFPLGTTETAEDRNQQLWRVANPVGLWYSDNSLSYYALKLQAYGLRAKGRFAVAGYGSELYKGNYGLRPVTAVVDSIARTQPSVAESVRDVCEEVLHEIGISASDPLSAEWHYLALRNALHGGRFTPVTKFGLRPLQQRNLVGLSKLTPDRYPDRMTGPRNIPDDLLLLLSPALATRPFDRAEKDRSPREVVDRLRRLGGPVSSAELTSYRVFGEAEDVADGPVPSLMSFVDQDRLRGRLTRAVVAPLVDAAADVVEASAFATEWAALVEQARSDVRDPAVPLGQARGVPGRVLALAEVLR